jgi:hypothetical protein
MVLHNDEDDERKRPFHEEGGGVGGEEEEEEGVELSGLSLNAVAVIAENPTEKGEEEHAAHRGIVGDVEAAVPLVDGNVGGCAAPLADTDTRREKRKAQIGMNLKFQ